LVKALVKVHVADVPEVLVDNPAKGTLHEMDVVGAVLRVEVEKAVIARWTRFLALLVDNVNAREEDGGGVGGDDVDAEGD
jgi:hypothetical protein